TAGQDDPSLAMPDWKGHSPKALGPDASGLRNIALHPAVLKLEALIVEEGHGPLCLLVFENSKLHQNLKAIANSQDGPTLFNKSAQLGIDRILQIQRKDLS